MLRRSQAVSDISLCHWQLIRYQEVKSVSSLDKVDMDCGGRDSTLFQANFYREVMALVVVSSSVVYSVALMEQPSILYVLSSSTIDIAPS